MHEGSDHTLLEPYNWIGLRSAKVGAKLQQHQPTKNEDNPPDKVQ